ncbi:DNA polymerase III subunit beta [Botrimarina sp.]|uniref:DNA polymerase III subunit beta n=1 Tax=Botrimarina sp. TaxID=2795802 RepID=UPI0032EFFB94
MKISCDREKLLWAFQAVAAVAPPRSPKPILQNVKLDVADGGAATLSATDLEVSIRREVEGVEAEAPGSVLLPVVRFGAILRESSDTTFRIETDGSKTLVRGERSRFNLPSENPGEFPSVAAFDADAYYQAPTRLLKEMIRRTIFATDNESSRYALGGVKLEVTDEGRLIAVGTDGRRLAKMEGAIERVGDAPPVGDATIVPTRSLQLIDRTLVDEEAPTRLAVRANDAVFATPTATLSTRLLEGRYPRWRDVVPTRSESAKVELTVGPFFAAVRQAQIVTSDESRGVDFQFGEGTLVLEGQTAEVGESHIELPIGYDGNRIEIMLDPRFMVDFLKTLDAEQSFTLDLVDSDSAAVASTDDGYTYVLMPLARDRG